MGRFLILMVSIGWFAGATYVLYSPPATLANGEVVATFMMFFGLVSFAFFILPAMRGK